MKASQDIGDILGKNILKIFYKCGYSVGLPEMSSRGIHVVIITSIQ